MKTQEAIDLAGSTANLAKIFGISSAAIYQWGNELPQGRVWQLKCIRPEWFTESGRAKRAKRSGEEV
jgi:hypothetical protein